MANVLSQNEIDELLNALASGEDTTFDEQSDDESNEIKTYDFRTANKFSKDQMRTLHFIYDNYASRLSTYLSGTLRTICEVEMVSIEEQSFSEISNSMPSPVIISIINMPPLAGSMLFEISPIISYEIINRVLGGTTDFPETDKAFTEIELSIIERIVRRMINMMDEAWEKIKKVSATFDRIETSSQYTQIVSANEPIAIITMNVQIGDVSDTINLCIPHVAIQPIAKQLVMKTWYSENYSNMNTIDKNELKMRLANITLNLNAVFNDTFATIEEIVGTQVGDVIQINHNINNSIILKVEHIPKFRGFIGMQDSNYAVEISDILEEETQDEYAQACE